MNKIPRDFQFYRFCLYGFLKNLRIFEPFLILYLRSKGLSFFQIGSLISVREIASYVAEIPSGIIADMFGRKRAMLLSMSFYLLSFFIFYLGYSFLFFVIAMTLFGLGEAFRSGTHKALIFSYLEQKGITYLKVEYYGATRGASQLGSALNSLLSMVIVFISNGYNYIFLATIIPYILNFINLSLYPSELDKFTLKKKKAGIKSSVKDLWIILKNKKIFRVILHSITYDGIFKTQKEYIQPLIKQVLISIPLLLTISLNRKVAIFLGIMYFFIYLASHFASKNAFLLVKKFGSVNSALNNTYFITSIMMFGIALFIHIKSIIFIFIFFLLFFIFENMRRPVVLAKVTESLPNNDFTASILSVEAQLKAIFVSIFAPIVGIIADNFSISTSFIFIGIVSLIFYGVTYLKE